MILCGYFLPRLISLLSVVVQFVVTENLVGVVLPTRFVELTWDVDTSFSKVCLFNPVGCLRCLRLSP
jgi:hypothetical protein